MGKVADPTQSSSSNHCQFNYSRISDMGGSRRGQGSEPPWKVTKIYAFLAILVQIPWKITKLPSQHPILGHYRHASKTPYTYSGICLDHLPPPPPPQKKKKKIVKVGPSLTKLSGSVHVTEIRSVSNSLDPDPAQCLIWFQTLWKYVISANDAKLCIQYLVASFIDGQ